MLLPHLEIDGTPASAERLAPALVNYGHFTSLQVRAGRVAGLALHLQRLQQATRELYGVELDAVRVRGWLAGAVERAGSAACAASGVRLTVFAPQASAQAPAAAGAGAVAVLVAVSPARPAVLTPLRVQLRRYERELPRIKHVGTFGALWQRQLAQRDGYDDALFADARGCLSEGSTWNVGFWDGVRVIWPQAAMLDGTSQQLLKPLLRAAGIDSIERPVHRDELALLRAAFVCSSGGVGRPIASIDAQPLAAGGEITARLRALYADAPTEPLF